MRLVSMVFAVGLAALLFLAQGDVGGVSAHVEYGNSVASEAGQVTSTTALTFDSWIVSEWQSFVGPVIRLLREAAVVVAHVHRHLVDLIQFTPGRRQLLKEQNLRPVRPHDLRQLGHSSVQLTLDALEILVKVDSLWSTMTAGLRVHSAPTPR